MAYSIFLGPLAVQEMNRQQYYPGHKHIALAEVFRAMEEDPLAQAQLFVESDSLWCRRIAGMRVLFTVDKVKHTVAVRTILERKDAFRMPDL